MAVYHILFQDQNVGTMHRLYVLLIYPQLRLYFCDGKTQGNSLSVMV